MKKPITKKQKHHDQSETIPNNSSLESQKDDKEQKQVDELPSVEWGDRINSGKAITRAGKEEGFVPGAMPDE